MAAHFAEDAKAIVEESAAGKLRSAIESGAVIQTKSSKPRPKSVVGGSQHNVNLKSVRTERTVDIFIPRLHPQTTNAEIINCVNEVKGELKVIDVKCERLKSRYEHLYCSVYVAIQVESPDFSEAISMFMSSQSWPVGVLVRRCTGPSL